MKKIKDLFKKQGFTLVELIIVIAIIAVLAVAAFMMLTKWLGKSRDSRRLGDLGTIARGLTVGYSDTDDGINMYPDIMHQDDKIGLMSGDEVVGYQGRVDSEVIKGASMQKVPLDPSDNNEYTYLVTQNRQKFQLLGMLEDGTEVGVLNTVFALDYGNRYPASQGFELGVLLQKDTNLPIQYAGVEFTGIDLMAGTERENYKAIISNTISMVGSGMENIPIVNEEIVVVASETPVVELSFAEKCEAAGWFWIPPENDVYIGTEQGDGFCISPAYGDWDSYPHISFSGWGKGNASYRFGSWDVTIYDSGNNQTIWGQTRFLDGADASGNQVSYGCKSLGEAESDYITEDSLMGRMKWLASTGSEYEEAKSIDWITGISPATNTVIPAIFIADCIDGTKDLKTTMTYIHNNNSTEEVTYAEYSANVTDSTETVSLTNVTYQNRQKYLTAWTQKSGGHLPSAFSYISNGTSGSGKGELQVACEANLMESNKGSILSAVGQDTGFAWGRTVRTIGGTNGCGTFGLSNTGDTLWAYARFVVRP